MYDVAIHFIESYIANYLPLFGWAPSKAVFAERSFARWAANEILMRIQREFYDIPNHISGRVKPSVKEIIDDYIFELDGYLELKYNWMFDVGLTTAKSIMRYLSRIPELEIKKGEN